MIKKIFIKSFFFIIIFSVISLLLQDNRVLWGIVTGMLIGLVNFSLMCSLLICILNTKRRMLRILCLVILPFKLLLMAVLIGVFLVFTSVHWAGMLLSINFILLLIIWEFVFGKEKICSEEAVNFARST